MFGLVAGIPFRNPHPIAERLGSGLGSAPGSGCLQVYLLGGGSGGLNWVSLGHSRGRPASGCQPLASAWHSPVCRGYSGSELANEGSLSTFQIS